MVDDDAPARSQEPRPNPALGSLDVIVGTCDLTGRESGPVGEIPGRVTLEWMEGGFFLVQRVDVDYVERRIAGTKNVVSTTLDEVEWANSTLIRGNVAEEISRLKQQPGKNITITGSGTLVESLLRQDLLDELGLMVHPIVVGRGKRLFGDGGEIKGPELVDSKTFSKNVVYLTYRPAGS